MAPRGEAEMLQENQGLGAARARRVAGGLDSNGDHGSAQNRGGREKRERSRGLIQIRIFLKNFDWNLENFEYESCREFKSLQLLFQEKVYSSNGLKVILNFRKL